MSNNFCIFNSFLMASQIAEAEKEELDGLERRLAWLDCKMGRIDYSVMPKEENIKLTKVNIHMMSLHEDDYQAVYIHKHTTVQEVIEELSVAFKIKSLRDFGLFLDYQGIPRLLDRDEKLLSIL